jgi:hypothetical protein
VVSFSFDAMMAETCFAFSPADVISCEKAIIQFLEWRLVVPTASEILKQLLFLANPYQDF